MTTRVESLKARTASGSSTTLKGVQFTPAKSPGVTLTELLIADWIKKGYIKSLEDLGSHPSLRPQPKSDEEQ